MYVAIDIGGTKTLIILYSEDGEELARDKHPTDTDFNEFINSLGMRVQDMADKHDEDVDVIAVAAPGVMDYESLKVHAFGNLDWHDVDIRGQLANRFECPVIVDNDGNMGALGEANEGAGRDYESVLYITISTGIGTGITFQKQIDRALRRSEGGMMHFRHDGKLQRWEQFASGKAFYERYGKMGVEVEKGDERWSEWAEDVSLGIGSLMAIVQPDVIVIGGSMGEHLEKYRGPLINALQATRSPVVQIPPIVMADKPHEAVINGCLVAARNYAANF